MGNMKELDVKTTRMKLKYSGRSIAGYANAHGWSSDSFRSYLNGNNPLRYGSRAWKKYIPQLIADGLAVFHTEVIEDAEPETKEA